LVVEQVAVAVAVAAVVQVVVVVVVVKDQSVVMAHPASGEVSAEPSNDHPPAGDRAVGDRANAICCCCCWCWWCC
jgi:hypothetical protein